MAKSEALDPTPVARTTAKRQDDVIMRGHEAVNGGLTEDQKREAGIDASQGAGPHDPSPEANRGTGGGLYDTYAGNPQVEHPNLAGPTTPLVLGQAPAAPVVPMQGSRNVGEQVDMGLPNAINQSPVVRGVDEDGSRTEAPTFEDLKPDNTKHADPDAAAKQANDTVAKADESE